MKRSITYTHARKTLATLCDEVISSREPTVITRRDKDDVALIAAVESIRECMIVYSAERFSCSSTASMIRISAKLISGSTTPFIFLRFRSRRRRTAPRICS